MIAEFLARNDAGLRDGDGSAADWIEIFNAGDMAVDLAGYHLTDDADLPRGGRFRAWCSSRGSTRLCSHRGGMKRTMWMQQGICIRTSRWEGTASIGAGGAGNRVLSEFGPAGQDYPPQGTDVSYGIAQSATVLDDTSLAAFLVPATPAVDAIWTRLDFDPAAHGFTSGTASLGYEGRPADRVNFTGHFDTTLPAGPHAVYARIAFSLEDASAVASLQLRLKYDNGFIAYLNGVRVAEDNAPSVLGWSATVPSGTRRDADALEYVQFDLSAHRTALVDGENVLALHGLNSLSDSHDMLLVPELTVGRPI